MIKANELRIGNFVKANGLHGGEVREVSAITDKGTLSEDRRVIMFKESNNVGEFISDCQGIELTPQWIINLGFKDEGKEIYSKGVADTSYCLQSRSKAGFDDGGYFFGIRFDDWEPDSKTITNFAYEVKFVHHLMNLFYSVSGRELELKKLI